MLVPAVQVDLSAYIEARFFDGRPHVRGRRLPVWVLAHTAADNGYGVADLMAAFDLAESEVLAVLLYYAQHQDAIEAQEAAIRDAHRQLYEQD